MTISQSIQTQTLPMSVTSQLGDQTQPLRDEQTDLPVLNVTKPVQFSKGVSGHTKQHVILVRDTSGSMAGTKIDELNIASSALCNELALPENKDGFLISVVEFSTNAHRSIFAEPATTLSIPMAIATGGTKFDNALLETIQTIEAFSERSNLDGYRFLRPQVLFLSDGHSTVSDQNIIDLQEIANVTTIAYGTDADIATLGSIASDGQVHIIGTDGGALRQFLAEVGKTLSQSLSSAR